MSSSSIDDNKTYVWVLKYGEFTDSYDGTEQEVYATLEGAERADQKVLLKEYQEVLNYLKECKRERIALIHLNGRTYDVINGTGSRLAVFDAFWSRLTDDTAIDKDSAKSIFEICSNDFIHTITKMELKP